MAASIDRTDSLPSVPPPPPPPIEDSKYTVSYGNGADTYTNNMMADDESVEAQHVVYTFAEEGKSSKAGRKKWICLMTSIAALLIAIIALGSVYGTQRRSRANQIAQANEASLVSNATDVNTTEPVTLPEEDLYITPVNETLSNVTLSGNETVVANTTEIEPEPEPEDQTEPPTTWTTNFLGVRVFPTDAPGADIGTLAPGVGVGTGAPGVGTGAPGVGTDAPGVGTGAPGVGTGAPVGSQVPFDVGTAAPSAGGTVAGSVRGSAAASAGGSQWNRGNQFSF